jgi:hypothetical protein
MQATPSPWVFMSSWANCLLLMSDFSGLRGCLLNCRWCSELLGVEGNGVRDGGKGG